MHKARNPPVPGRDFRNADSPSAARSVLRALFHGSLRPRRRGPRRADERGVSAVDWHHPQWLAVSMLIVIVLLHAMRS